MADGSVDVILRHEVVERAKAGDKMLFSGTLIVIPDVSQLSGGMYFFTQSFPLQAQPLPLFLRSLLLTSGKIQLQSRGPQRARDGYSQEGITGLKVILFQNYYTSSALSSFLMSGTWRSRSHVPSGLSGHHRPASQCPRGPGDLCLSLAC